MTVQYAHRVRKALKVVKLAVFGVPEAAYGM